MLSSDKNVETIAQLIEVLKHYLGLQTEYVKLDVIVRLLTATALAIVFFFIIIAVLMYLSFAIAFWLAAYVGTAWGFFIVSVFHLVLFLLVIYFRKPWIQKPLVHFLAELLLSK